MYHPSSASSGSISDALVNQIVRFGYEAKFETLPSHVAGEAKRLLLDSIGCALGAVTVEKGQRAIAVAKEMAGPPEATVIGTRERLPAAAAAFANGELINALDYDSLITPPGHVVPYVIPAILGMAETQKASGKALLTAIAVAHEVSARLGRAMGYYRDVKPGQKIDFPAISGFSSTIFGGTLGVAMLRGLDAETAANALGLAGHNAPVQTLGKWGRTLPGSDDKYLLSGGISQAELLAVLMAEKGYRGDIEVLDGDYGFWRFIGSSGWKPEAVTDGLGTRWFFPDVTIYKPWPHCRNSNTALDCLKYLIDKHDLKPDEIEKITACWDSHTATLPIWTTKDIRTFSDAQMSTAYGISMVMHGVELGPAWYDHDTLTNPKYLAFLDRVDSKPHPRFEDTLLEDPQTRIGSVEVVARRQTFFEERRYRKGSPATPETRMSDEDLAEKFRINAARVISSAAADQLIDMLLNLEAVEDVSTIAALY
jgi:2-methylcitrate dehydratase PrpD